MAVDISQAITNNWPVTEKTVLNASDPTVKPPVASDYYDYATAKTAAIAKAKRKLYGDAAVPVEASIPEIAADWIADQATVYLIPVAIDFYMVLHRRSDSKDEANFTYYDKAQELKDFRDELEGELAKNKDEALDAIDDSDAPENYTSTPSVSTAGLYVDPMTRATVRGPVL